MQTCNKCIVNDNYPGISFNDKGECSLCDKQKIYKPIGEDKLIKIFNDVKNTNVEYEALVPLSGGKDSTYILHLAVNVYKLKVLSMTYDNGFLSQTALDNIERAIKKTNVKHIFCKPDKEIQKNIYRNMLLYSGDICGACDIGTKVNIIKVAQDYSVPLVLYGTSPLEEDSFVPDSIQDITRFKYILKQSKEFSKKEIEDFLIYPNLNLFKQSFYKSTGKMAREVRPLFFIENPTDKRMGEVISKEMDWQDDFRQYSKHFDCIAEPLTNYIRNKIYGYERRRCQFSNMIRRNEISREQALELFSLDKIEELPENYKEILDYLNISEKELGDIIKIPSLKYEKHTSKTNKFYTRLMNIKKSIK